MSGPDTYLGRRFGEGRPETREERHGHDEPDERAVGWDEDLQDDLAAERLGITPKLGMPSGPSVSGREMATRLPGRVEDDRCGRQAQSARTPNTTLRKRAA